MADWVWLECISWSWRDMLHDTRHETQVTADTHMGQSIPVQPPCLSSSLLPAGYKRSFTLYQALILTRQWSSDAGVEGREGGEERGVIVLKHHQAGTQCPGGGSWWISLLSILFIRGSLTARQSVTKCEPTDAQRKIQTFEQGLGLRVMFEYNVLLTEMLNPNLAATDPILLF